jgi:multisubunit Na+/H+ antiporter MnhE subunit
LIQAFILAFALALVWLLLAPSDFGEAPGLAWAACAFSALATALFAVRGQILGGRSGAAIGVTLGDALRSAPRAFAAAVKVLARVLMGPPPRPALAIVQVRTAEQAQAARVAAALSRTSHAYTIDGDERTMLVHVLDEQETSPDALHAAANAFAPAATRIGP